MEPNNVWKLEIYLKGKHAEEKSSISIFNPRKISGSQGFNLDKKCYEKRFK